MSTIMLVDDSATILLSVASILSKAGYTVEKAANAELALQKFNAGAKVNLLITDLNMPAMIATTTSNSTSVKPRHARCTDGLLIASARSAPAPAP